MPMSQVGVRFALDPEGDRLLFLEGMREYASKATPRQKKILGKTFDDEVRGIVHRETGRQHTGRRLVGLPALNKDCGIFYGKLGGYKSLEEPLLAAHLSVPLVLVVSLSLSRHDMGWREIETFIFMLMSSASLALAQ